MAGVARSEEHISLNFNAGAAASGRFRSVQLAITAWKSVYGKWHFYCTSRGIFASMDACQGCTENHGTNRAVKQRT